MKRFSKTVDVEVDVDIDLDDFDDEDLIDELKSRKVDMHFIDFEFPIMDDQEFRVAVIEMVYKMSSDRASILLEAIKNSYHFPWIKDTKCDQ